MCYIFYMSSGPVEAAVFSKFPDFVLHAFGYSVFYVVAHWAIHEGLPLVAGRGGYWLPWLATVLYGASDEFHQSFVPSRQCAAGDLLADAVGGLVGALAVILVMLFKWRGLSRRAIGRTPPAV
jgi:VanZ family protein